MLAKLRIEKPCETRICETLLILRNKYKTAKEILDHDLRKHDLRNMARHCETLVAKVAKLRVAKIV